MTNFNCSHARSIVKSAIFIASGNYGAKLRCVPPFTSNVLRVYEQDVIHDDTCYSRVKAFHMSSGASLCEESKILDSFRSANLVLFRSRQNKAYSEVHIMHIAKAKLFINLLIIYVHCLLIHYQLDLS